MASFRKTQTMPRAYSDDLRCKILQAYERAEVGLERLADQFGVSYGLRRRFGDSSCNLGRWNDRAATSWSGKLVRSRCKSTCGGRCGVNPIGPWPNWTRLEQSLHVQLSKTRLCLELQRLGLPA